MFTDATYFARFNKDVCKGQAKIMINPLEATVWAVISHLISRTLSFQLLFKDREEYETGLDEHCFYRCPVHRRFSRQHRNHHGKRKGYYRVPCFADRHDTCSKYELLQGTCNSKVFQTLFLEHDGLKKKVMSIFGRLHLLHGTIRF